MAQKKTTRQNAPDTNFEPLIFQAAAFKKVINLVYFLGATSLGFVIAGSAIDETAFKFFSMIMIVLLLIGLFRALTIKGTHFIVDDAGITIEDGPDATPIPWKDICSTKVQSFYRKGGGRSYHLYVEVEGQSKAKVHFLRKIFARRHYIPINVNYTGYNPYHLKKLIDERLIYYKNKNTVISSRQSASKSTVPASALSKSQKKYTLALIFVIITGAFIGFNTDWTEIFNPLKTYNSVSAFKDNPPRKHGRFELSSQGAYIFMPASDGHPFVSAYFLGDEPIVSIDTEKFNAAKKKAYRYCQMMKEIGNTLNISGYMYDEKRTHFSKPIYDYSYPSPNSDSIKKAVRTLTTIKGCEADISDIDDRLLAFGVSMPFVNKVGRRIYNIYKSCLKTLRDDLYQDINSLMADKYEQIRSKGMLMMNVDHNNYKMYQILMDNEYLDRDYRFQNLDIRDAVEKTFDAVLDSHRINVRGEFIGIDQKTGCLSFDGYYESATDP